MGRSTWWRTIGVVAALAIVAAGCDDGDDTDAAPDPDVEAVVAPIPDVEGPITEPGDPYLDPLELGFPDEDAVAAHGYVFEEWIASGTAAGESYRVRVQVARPEDEQDFSGHTIVEAIHPQGIPFVWNFTRDHLMSQGHAAVNVSVFPNTVETLRDTNEGRYGELTITADEASDTSDISFAHSSDVYAQVGAWLKSDDAPLAGVQWLHMTGHSMSVGPVWQYMDSHHAEQRLEGGDPIYDGFFPETTRTASRMGPFPEVDVPTLLINSELEVDAVLVDDGIDYRRPDSDEPGEQFRLYEVAGMPHNPAWMHPLLHDSLDIVTTARERCVNPLNSFPYDATISMALDHLIRWVGDDVAPPSAEPIELTGEPGDDDLAIARDEHGNALGGVRGTTLDVPIATYLGVNEPQDPQDDLTPGSCLVYGSQLDFDADELLDLYGDHETYVAQVEDRLDELVADGWFLELFADEIRDRAAAFTGFDG